MNPFDIPSVVKCPACGRTNGVPTRGGTFECMFCGARIDLSRIAPDAPVVTDQSLTTPSFFQPREEALPLPGVAYTAASEGAYDPGRAELLTHRWYNPAAGLELIGMIAYTAIMAVVLLTFFADTLGAQSWLLMLFIATLVFSGVSSIYRNLARLINTTRMRLQGEALVVRHGPLPWPGVRQPVEAIERLTVEANMTRGRRRVLRGYDLKAVLKNGRSVTLLPMARHRADAEALAAALGARLGLRA